MAHMNSMVLRGLRPARYFTTKEEAVERVQAFESGWDTSVAAQLTEGTLTLTVRYNAARVAGFQRAADEAAAETLRRVGKKLESTLLPPPPKKKKEKDGEISKAAPPARLTLSLRTSTGAVQAHSEATEPAPANSACWELADSLSVVPSEAALSEGGGGKGGGVSPDAKWVIPVVCNPPEALDCSVEAAPLTLVPQLLRFAGAPDSEVLWFSVEERVIADGEDPKKKKRGMAFVPTCDNTLRHEGTRYLGTGTSITPAETEAGKRLCVVVLPQQRVSDSTPAPESPAATYTVRKGMPTILLTAKPVLALNTALDHVKYPPPEQADGKDRIRVLTYNILYEGATEVFSTGNPMYPYADPEFVKISYRKQLILREIAEFRPDIVCLQEVATSLHEGYLASALGELGYGEGHHVHKLGDTREGVSTFWRKDKFRCLDASSLALGGPDVLTPATPESCRAADAPCANPALSELQPYLDDNPKVAKCLQKTSTVGQVLVLEEVAEGGRKWVVGNTHLWFHPMGSHVRLLQAHMLCRAVERKKKEFNAGPVVICGDLNCMPKSAPHRYLVQGTIPSDHPTWSAGAVFDFGRWDFEEGTIVPAEESSEGLVQVPGLPLSHSLSLSDATPDFAYSNYTPTFTGRLDYILHSTHIAPSYAHPLPLPDVLSKEGGGIPASCFPSDHLPICADFQVL
eukprot:gene17225-26448_t